MKKNSIVCFVVAFVIILVILIVDKYYIKFDNNTTKTDLITETYDISEFSETLEMIDSWEDEIYVYDLDIEPQCIRKTDVGGYIIYSLKSGEELYLFFNDKKNILAYSTVKKFISSNEFMQYEDKYDFDLLSLGSGVSSIGYGSGIESLLYFFNDNKLGWALLENVPNDNKRIDRIWIKDNDDYLDTDSTTDWLPYILPMDRY